MDLVGLAGPPCGVLCSPVFLRADEATSKCKPCASLSPRLGSQNLYAVIGLLAFAAGAEGRNGEGVMTQRSTKGTANRVDKVRIDPLPRDSAEATLLSRGGGRDVRRGDICPGKVIGGPATTVPMFSPNDPLERYPLPQHLAATARGRTGAAVFWNHLQRRDDLESWRVSEGVLEES